MKKSNLKKVLNINIEYMRDSEMKKCLEHILKSMELRNFDRRNYSNCIYEWQVKHAEFKEYRVEIINGETCMVIPSKLNIT